MQQHRRLTPFSWAIIGFGVAACLGLALCIAIPYLRFPGIPIGILLFGVAGLIASGLVVAFKGHQCYSYHESETPPSQRRTAMNCIVPCTFEAVMQQTTLQDEPTRYSVECDPSSLTHEESSENIAVEPEMPTPENTLETPTAVDHRCQIEPANGMDVDAITGILDENTAKSLNS